MYVYLLDVPKQPICMNGGYRELYQQLQSPSGRARANGTRASAHVTFQRTTSERKLCFSAKLRRQRCCLAERCLQGILPAHTLSPPGRAREQKRTTSGFSLRNRSSPQFLRWQLVPPSSSVHVSNGQATRVRVRATAFSSPATLPGNSHIVQPRRQPGDGSAEETTRRRFSRGDNQETVQLRRQPGDSSAEKQREIPTKRTGETTCFFPAHREKPRVWALESHVTDNFTLRTMGGVHTCRLLRNVQQICCSAQQDSIRACSAHAALSGHCNIYIHASWFTLLQVSVQITSHSGEMHNTHTYSSNSSCNLVVACVIAACGSCMLVVSISP